MGPDTGPKIDQSLAHQTLARASAAGILVSLRGFPPGLPDGEQRITTPDGKVYYGDVRGGQPEGRGLVMMPDGSRYEGSLSQGRASGAGMYIQPGGGAFYGNWLRGRLHGEVVHTFPGMKAISICLYDHGRLEREEVLEVGDHKVKLSRRERKRVKELYRAPQPGELVYRGHRSYVLVQQLQLGLTYSIAQSGSRDVSRQLKNGVFEQKGMEVRKQTMPGTGTVPGFLWKEYLPATFQKLREMFGIDNGDFLLSMTGDETLRVVPSTGKSGSIFVVSGDDRFMAKTVRKEEMRIILNLIAQYYEHCLHNRSTLLVRFYGIYRVSPVLGRRVRFLLMQNALPTHLRLHRRYDLKGSRYGRTAGGARVTKPFVTLKDLDVDAKFILPAAAHAAVIQQLASDCELLERLNVMDYSLLLGVHFVRWGNENWAPPFGDWGRQPLDPEDIGSKVNATTAMTTCGATNVLPNKQQSPPDLGPRTSAAAQANGQNTISPPAEAAASVPNGTNNVTNESSSSSFRQSPNTSEPSAHTLAGLLRTLTHREDELDAIVRSAASMVTHVGRSSVAAWNSAVRLGQEERPPSLVEQQVLSRQLSQVEERTQGLRGAGAGRSTHLLPRLRVIDPGTEGMDAASEWILRQSSIACSDVSRRARSSSSVVEMEGGGAAAAGGGYYYEGGGDTATGSTVTGGTPRQGQQPLVPLSIGTAMPALAVQTEGDGAEGAMPQPVLLYFAIIDFLQDYNFRKKIEHAIKSQFHPSEDISVLNARDYSQRFQQMIKELFVAGPTCSTPSPAGSGQDA